MATKTHKPYEVRLKTLYEAEVKQELLKELELKNVHRVPRLEKIVVAVGLGRAKDEKALMDGAANTLRKITGQQPVTTKAKKAIASFKLREGNIIGLKVTLRDKLMYEFLDRLVNVVMPRVRDFHGVPNGSFDKGGNYSLGIVEQSVFPELSFEDTLKQHGIQVTFVVKQTNPSSTKLLLTKLGLPFEKPHGKTLEKPAIKPPVKESK